MHNDDARHIHQLLTDKVRAGHRVSGLRFRCDSPALRRYMEMDISLLSAGEVEYRSRVLNTEQRAPLRLLSNYADVHIVMCGWCKMVDYSGQWVEVEEAVRALGLFERDRMPPISHGMCDTCLKAIQDL